MSKLSKETTNRIKAEAEQYANQFKHGAGYREPAYTDGATEWAGRAQEPLINLLDEARLQIEYLHKKFGATGSGNNVLARIETELAKYKEVGNE